MGILQDIMNQWADPYRRTVALHGINVEGGFPGAGTAAGQQYGGPGYYYQFYQGGNPNGGNSVSRYFPTSQAGIDYAARNPNGELKAGGYSGFDTNGFSQRFQQQPMMATDWQVAQIERPTGYNSGRMVYNQTPNVWNNVTYPNLNTLGINPETYQLNPNGEAAARQYAAQDVSQRAPTQPAQATPPTQNSMFFDDATKRWYRYDDFRDEKGGYRVRMSDEVTSWEQTPDGWKAYGANVPAGAKDTTAQPRQKASVGSMPQQMSYQPQQAAKPPQQSYSGAPRSPFYMGGMAGAANAMGQQGATLGQRPPMFSSPPQNPYQNVNFGSGFQSMPRQQAVSMVQNNPMGTFNVGGSGQMLVANGNGQPMLRAPMNISSFSQPGTASRPPALPTFSASVRR